MSLSRVLRLAPILVSLALLTQAQEPTRPESLMTAPLYLGVEPPECRSVRTIRLEYGDGSRVHGRVREQALALARNLRGLIVAGADFKELARAHSQSPSARNGGHLGTHAPGVLVPEFGDFLFAAKLGDVSAPIDIGGAIHLLQRTERWAACRQIFLKGRGEEVRALADELVKRLREGADFGALAREHSADPASAKHGGAWRIFERGRDDSLLKRAAFEVHVGEIFGPLASPLGFHIGRRDAIGGFDESLRERNWVRATGILIAHEKARVVKAGRGLIAAADLAKELHALALDRSQGLSELAAKHTDEPGGQARQGDLGWIYRGNPNRLGPLERLFLVPAGTLLEPKHTDEGWILLQRTR